MNSGESYQVSPIGIVHSTLKERSGAPRQPWEGAPAVRVEIYPPFHDCAEGVDAGQEIWILTWLHQSRRDTHKVRPRGCMTADLTGVFATRAPDRPNPVGLHRAKVVAVDAGGLHLEALEAIDGTPVIDIKPVLERASQF